LIIVYTPADGEPEQYDASTLRVSEAAIVQRTVDMKWQEILAGLEQDDLDAMRGIVWVLKKRTTPSLRYGEFDPGVTEMVCRLSRTEIEAYVSNAFEMVGADPEVTEETVVQILRARLPMLAADPDHALALLDARAQDPKEQATPDVPEEAVPASAPQDPSPSPTSSEPGPSTSASSPTSSTSHPEPSTISSLATSTT
jgi:hypothetical protein